MASAFADELYFTVHGKEFNHRDIKVCYLDENYVERLKSLYDKNMTKNQAISLFKKNKSLYVDYTNFILCAYKANSLGIKRLPAIVYDEKYVVYGFTNIENARVLYEDFK